MNSETDSSNNEIALPIQPFFNEFFREQCHDISSLPVVGGVNAGIVDGTVNLNPIGAIDPPLVPGRRTDREGRCHFEPAVRSGGDAPHFVCNFRKVLVLAEYNGDIARAGYSSVYDI